MVDEFARFHPNERDEVFAVSADALGVPSVVVEKDFWVCWTLRRLFSTGLRAAIAPEQARADASTMRSSPLFVFKGGTSLSKVFGAIDRFSEDIDITVDRVTIGAPSPVSSDSRKTRERLREAIEGACIEWTRETIKTALSSAIEATLDPREDWSLDLDPNAREATLVFRYPSKEASAHRYLLPSIRIEFGARGEQEPSEDASVSPMAAATVPQAFKEPKTTVRAMSAARTFWEKATLLHGIHHRGAPIRARQARHYFDVFRLADHRLGRAARADRALLGRVVEHRELLDLQPSARYREAAEGMIRLVPQEKQLVSLEEDYRAMRDMFLAEPPSVGAILKRLERLEREVNGAGESGTRATR